MGRKGDVNLEGTIQKKELMQVDAGCESCYAPLRFVHKQEAIEFAVLLMLL